MTGVIRSGLVAAWTIGGFVTLLGVASVAYWKFAPTTLRAYSQANTSGVIDVPYEHFRTLLVRENPTRAIIENSGMQLTHEELIDVTVDVSRDRRPLLNALMRQSQSSVQSHRRIIVAVNNEEIRAQNLVLLQEASVSPDSMEVISTSETPAGDLTYYRTSLYAEPSGRSTSVRVTVEIEIEKRLSKWFHEEAQKRLDASSTNSVQEQLDSLQQYVMLSTQQ
jgi:hypothetical protein